MTIRPFDLRCLERVPALGVTAVRRAAARLGDLDQRVEFRVAPFGLVSLRCLAITVPTDPEDSDSVWMLSRPDPSVKRGYLLIGALAALRIVAVTLGIPAPRTARRLGTAERGMACATIATLFRAAANDVTISLEQKTWRPDALACLHIEIDFGAFRERVRLHIPAEWIPATPVASTGSAAVRQDLEIPMAIELARTTVTARDWSRARLGDALVFDDTVAKMLDEDWAARLTCGDFSGDVLITTNGRVTMTSAFSLNSGTIETGNLQRQQLTGEIMSTDDRDSSSATVLASAPIEVIAEIGRVILRADEVMSLAPGAVLTLGPLRPSIVDLKIGARSWASGELVDVDGYLGVRLTALAQQPKPAPISIDDETVR